MKRSANDNTDNGEVWRMLEIGACSDYKWKNMPNLWSNLSTTDSSQLLPCIAPHCIHLRQSKRCICNFLLEKSTQLLACQEHVMDPAEQGSNVQCVRTQQSANLTGGATSYTIYTAATSKTMRSKSSNSIAIHMSILEIYAIATSPISTWNLWKNRN